jgi:hypothetical protein
MAAVTVTAVVTAAVTVEALALLLLIAAQVELFRDIAQLHEATGVIDRPLPIDLGRALDSSPSRFGLPAALDDQLGGMVLLCPLGCATCRTISQTLGGVVPQGVWILLLATSPAEADEWRSVYHFSDDRLVWDRPAGNPDSIAERIGVVTTPSALVVERGRLVRAQTVPSTRALFSLLAQITPSPA